jgi:hypothetical protein
MKYKVYLATLAVAMLAANGSAWNDSVLKQSTGLKIKALSEAEVAARKWGPTTEGFQLSVASDKETYDLGRPIMLSVLLRNVSNQPLRFGQTDVETDYNIEIVGADGKMAPLTAYGKELHSLDRPILHAFAVSLKTGESIEHTLPLDKLYDVSRVGVYNVTVTRKVPKENAPQSTVPPQFAEIRSNTIRITVLRPD